MGSETQEIQPQQPENIDTMFAAEQLAQLREDVEAGQFQHVVDTLIGKAVETGQAPTRKMIDTFVRSLSGEEQDALTNFLEGNSDTEEEQELHAQLQTLETEVSGETPAETSSSASGVIAAIDQGLSRLEGVKIPGLERFGITEITPEHVQTVRGFVVGIVAQIAESIASALKGINPNADLSNLLNIPLELRLLEIEDPVEKEKYREAYLERARQPGEFIPPTVEEALNPVPAVAATETQEQERQKVEASPVTVTLSDGNTYTVAREEDSVIVDANGTKRKAAVRNETLVDVFVRQPVGEEAGGVDLVFAENRTVTADAAKMREAVTEGDTSMLATDDATVITLSEVTSA